jgi:hypothetical protein
MLWRNGILRRVGGLESFSLAVVRVFYCSAIVGSTAIRLKLVEALAGMPEI